MSRLITLPLYTTLYILPFLRMLGVKIGKRAELSVLSYFSPDLAESDLKVSLLTVQLWEVEILKDTVRLQ